MSESLNKLIHKHWYIQKWNVSFLYEWIIKILIQEHHYFVFLGGSAVVKQI